MDVQEQFREWFRLHMPPSYKNWDRKLDDIKNAYFTSFKRNVFNVDLDNIDSSINNILSDLENRNNVSDKTFADYNKKSSNGIPQAILRTYLIPFLENYPKIKSGVIIENTYTEKPKYEKPIYESSYNTANRRKNNTEITPEMVRQAYIIAKNIYNNEISKYDGIKILHDEYKMNKNSAKMYTNNFRYLINGKRYIVCMKADDTKYFLIQILNDYGEDKFKQALYSVKQHIEYKKGEKIFLNELEHIYMELIRKYNIKDERLIKISIENKPVINDNETKKTKLVNNNDGGKVEFIPDKETFRKRLLKYRKANWTIIYNDGKTKNGIWNASNMTEKSDVVNNIRSKFLRNWKEKEIMKVILEVKDFGQIKHEPIRDENTAYTRPKENFLSDKPNDIFDRAMGKIKDINRECKNRNKIPIFKPLIYEYSGEIEESCTSLSNNITENLYKIIFKDFISNLYIMIYETTREEKSNNTKGKPFYDYKLPDGFLNKGTTTRYFMDIVGTLRHHYVHLEPEYKESIKKISWGDVLYELLGNRNEPKSREDFQKLQIKVLKLFEGAMEVLLEIVKKK